MWNFAAQSVHSPGPAQNVGSHLTLSFQVSTGWRRRKRSRNSFRNTRRQWGMSTAAFCRDCRDKGTPGEEGCWCKALSHLLSTTTCEVRPCISAYRCMHPHSHKAIPVFFDLHLSLLDAKHWWCSHKLVQACVLRAVSVPVHASTHTHCVIHQLCT